VPGSLPWEQAAVANPEPFDIKPLMQTVMGKKVNSIGFLAGNQQGYFMSQLIERLANLHYLDTAGCVRRYLGG
jgi:hypothetical protein